MKGTANNTPKMLHISVVHFELALGALDRELRRLPKVGGRKLVQLRDALVDARTFLRKPVKLHRRAES